MSRDGKRLAYIAKRAGRGFIVCDGVEGPHYDSVNSPAFSPDGTKVAYAAGTEEEKHLWVVNADGSGARQLSKGIQYGDAYPAWSPDGKTILFTASADDKTGIYEINVKDGSTKHLMDGMMPDWRK